jgi:hypothetical protein
MRILVLVPTNIHKTTAGTRIRYDRLRDARDAYDIVVQSFEEFAVDEVEACDVCIFSKTFSVEAIVLAQQLRQAGKIIGVDVFDDYFTQTDDARLARFRTWLQCMTSICHFGLCSTHVIRDVLASYAPHLPVHVVPDPFPEIDPTSLATMVATKVARAKSERCIDVVWFGNGSNPFFPVGLHDVAAYAWSLADLASGSFDVRLTILTDKASLTPPNLARLRKLPVRHQIDIWSVEGERQALDRALVTFIPVNGQSFSRAKSFNRALTAISAGTQVLSPGFPLYRDLAPAIYGDALELLYGLEEGACRISAESAGDVVRAAATVSAIGAVADSFLRFLAELLETNGNRRPERRKANAKGGQSQREGLIYGFEYDGLMIRAARSAGILQVKTPFARRERAYDIQFEARTPRQLDVWISPKLTSLLHERFKNQYSRPQQRGKYTMVKVNAGSHTTLGLEVAASGIDSRAIIKETEAYRRYLLDIERMCRSLFPTIHFSLCDMQSYSAEAKAAPVGAER